MGLNDDTLFDANKITQAIGENKLFSQLYTEQNRYKQQCRIRAIDLAFNEPRKHILEPGETAETPEVLKNAEKYYNWMIEILPKM